MQYDFSLSPLGGQKIDAKGRFFKYRAGTGMIRVKLTDGAVVDLLPGQGVSNRNFESIELIDKSGAANSGTILAGDFDFRDDRITGTVDVVDGGKARTLANGAFGITISVPNAQTGLFNHHQLWNPANSGKRIVIDNMTFTSGTTSQSCFIDLLRTAPLATAYGKGASKCSGGALSVADAYTSQLAAQLFSSGLWFMTAGQQYKPTEPIVILPGAGLTIACQGPATTSYWGVEFFEESALA